MSPPTISGPPRGWTPWRWVAVLGLIVFAMGWGARWVRPRSSPPAPERDLAELVRREGILYEKVGETPFTGWMVDRYPNGILRSRSGLSNGVLEGVSEGWYTNGTLQIREHYHAGRGDGSVNRWREDGSVLSEGTARDGRLEGTYRRWHPNGQLAEQAFFRAGEPDGLSRAWYPDGSLRAEVTLDHGKVVNQTFWREGERTGSNLAVANPGKP